MDTDEQPPKPWFAAKRFGYGAGRPIAWQGWAVLLAYMGVMGGFAMILSRTAGGINWAAIVGMVAATLLMLWITAQRTRGGWRWRMGGEDPPPSEKKRRSRRHS